MVSAAAGRTRERSDVVRLTLEDPVHVPHSVVPHLHRLVGEAALQGRNGSGGCQHSLEPARLAQTHGKATAHTS